MCGIYGMVSLTGEPLRAPQVLDRMGRQLTHRGPDDRRVLLDLDAALGTERLQITDLRPEAALPFCDPAYRIWLTCNGAIYNAHELRDRYRDYPFRSRSDVEPLIPLYLEFGPAFVDRIDGMFAVVVWDAPKRRLLLARDRTGEKPLFYLALESEVWCASEVQALLEHPSLQRELDRRALADYVRLGYVRSPRTMFRGVAQVEPGTAVSFTATGRDVRRYWTPGAVAAEPIPVAEAERRLATLLEEAVARQMSADVPVGVFTSGGLDSGILAALARDRGGAGSLHTFTVGFPDSSYDERAPAERLAADVRSVHSTVLADEPALREAFEVVTTRLAEPLADPAILPTYLLSRAARAQVGVVLSGEGADELFGGYPTYLGHLFAPGFAALPRSVRAALGGVVRAIPASQAKVPLEFLAKRFVAHADRSLLDRHVAWFGTGLGLEVLREAPRDAANPLEGLAPEGEPLRQAMLLDYGSYLPDDLLAKVDRATMLASLEARAPYLDRTLTAFALALPSHLKVRGLETKWLLKRVAARWLPRACVRRRKRGLSVPVARWLNEGLRSEVDRLLEPERLRGAGLLDDRVVRELVGEHRSGRVNHARALWALVVLERWRERWCGA